MVYFLYDAFNPEKEQCHKWKDYYCIAYIICIDLNILPVHFFMISTVSLCYLTISEGAEALLNNEIDQSH